MRPTDNQKKSLFVVSCRLSKSSIGPSIHKSPLQKMLPHFHQNTIPQWKHETQSSKGKVVIIKRERGQVSTEKPRYVFLTTYALSKTKKKKHFKTYPNIHIIKLMTLRVLRQIKLNLLDIRSILNQLSLPKINLLKQP
jgi:hypothetical protein